MNMFWIVLWIALWNAFFVIVFRAIEAAVDATRIIEKKHNNCYPEHNRKPKRTFVCNYCGCTFETNKYTAHPSNITVIGTEENSIGLEPLCLTYHSECPNCGRDWVKEKK